LLKALRECDHPSALAARMALNEIPRPLWDRILDVTALTLSSGRCRGCDGHECDKGCQYPGAALADMTKDRT